jgi:hypothetical protein
MMQITPFDNVTDVTVYDPSDFAMNVAAAEFASVKFPVISTKGGRFHIKRDGERTLITRPKTNPTDPDEPASFIDVAVINLQRSKTFYVDGYTEGSEEKPDCFSNDGVTPDAQARNLQCSSCALCPQNVWGTGSNDKGEATKGKACSDVLRLAVAMPTALDDPFMLRVPPASLKNFAAMSKIVSDKRIPLAAVVVRVSFDTDVTGVMLFQAIGKMDSSGYAKSKSLTTSSLVLAITGKSSFTAPAAAAPAALAAPAPAPTPVAPDPAIAAKAEAEKAATAKKKAAAAAKMAKLQAEMAALEGDADVADVADVAAAPEPAPAAKGKTPVTNSLSSEFNDALADLVD